LRTTWQIRSTDKRTRLVHENLVIRGDWEIEIEFGNGVVSPQRIVAAVGTHEGGTWTATGGDISDGLQRSVATWAVPVLTVQRQFRLTLRSSG
jgi:hypothetical protein